MRERQFAPPRQNTSEAYVVALLANLPVATGLRDGWHKSSTESFASYCNQAGTPIVLVYPNMRLGIRLEPDSAGEDPMAKKQSKTSLLTVVKKDTPTKSGMPKERP